jgi:predicted nucleotidyltransferase
MAEKKNFKDIKNIINKSKPLLAEKYKVKDIGIFGSYARGEQKETSDLDVLVEFNERVGFFKFLELEEYLRELLKVNIDLVTKKALKPRIGQNILNEVVMI